jgi:hypothetical protein
MTACAVISSAASRRCSRQAMTSVISFNIAGKMQHDGDPGSSVSACACCATEKPLVASLDGIASRCRCNAAHALRHGVCQPAHRSSAPRSSISALCRRPGPACSGRGCLAMPAHLNCFVSAGPFQCAKGGAYQAGLVNEVVEGECRCRRPGLRQGDRGQTAGGDGAVAQVALRGDSRDCFPNVSKRKSRMFCKPADVRRKRSPRSRRS